MKSHRIPTYGVLLISCCLQLVASDLWAVNYYVRTSGNDNHDGTSASTAWKTIGRAVRAAGPNVVIYVGAGTYAETGTISITGSGTADDLFQIVGDNLGERTGDAGEVIIQAPSTAGGVYAFSLYQVNHIRLRNLIFEESPTASVPVYTATGPTEHNRYYENGNWSSGKNLPGAIQANQCTNIRIVDCNFRRLYHPVALHSTTDCIVNRCTFHDSRYMSLYVWCSRGLRVASCNFSHQSSSTTHNYVYQVYSFGSDVFVSNTVFDSQSLYDHAKILSRDGSIYPYQSRTVYMLTSHGMSYDQSLLNTYSAAPYAGHAGVLRATGCTFTAATGHAVQSQWNSFTQIANNTIRNCRTGVYSHSNRFVINRNTITNDSDSAWKNDWTYGVYANVFSSPNNRDNTRNPYHTSWVVEETPAGSVLNSTIENYRHGILLASADVSLRELQIKGHTDYTYTPSGWQGSIYTYGVYAYDNADNITFRGSDNVKLENHWVSYTTHDASVAFEDIDISGNYAGVQATRGSVNFNRARVNNGGFHGALLQDCEEVTATDSEFSNNCQAGADGWGFHYQGPKEYRTPQAKGGADWNAHQEYWVYGRPLGKVTLANCKFNDNGEPGVHGSGGLSLRSCAPDSIKLANNEATGNHAYGVYLGDATWNLSNHQEFTNLSGNYYGLTVQGYRDIIDQTLPWRSGKATITGYSIEDGAIGIHGADAELTLTDCKTTRHSHYGIYAYNGRVDLLRVTSNDNQYGLLTYYNLATNVRDCEFSNNQQYGSIAYLFQSWYGKDREYECTFDGVTANENNNGLYLATIRHQANGAWDLGDPTLFDVQNITCSKNRAHGLYLRGGWIDTSRSRNITCNNNGSYDANGNGAWAMGVVVEYPRMDIHLTDTAGIVAEGNSWGGVYVNNVYWLANAETGKQDLHAAESDLIATNYHSGTNRYYSVYVNGPRNVKVTDSSIAGLYAVEPQGTIGLQDSKFSGAWQGVVLTWGSFEDWNNRASGVVSDSWWNTYANIPIPFHKPEGITVQNCTFTDNVHAGFDASWWHNWTLVETDDNKRVAIAVADSTFERNGTRGVAVWNNHLALSNCTFAGNGISGALAWDGIADIEKCTFKANCFGRWNGTLHAFGEGTKHSWVACEINHNYADGRAWQHRIASSTFEGNEGYGLYVSNVNPGSTAEFRDSRFDSNHYSGVYAAYANLDIEGCTFNENGTPTYSAQGLIAVYNNARIVASAADRNTYGGFYIHGLYGTSPEDNLSHAMGDNTLLLSDCTANENGYRGILSWCNTGRIENCQALNTRPEGSTAITGTGMQVGYDDYAQTYHHEIVNCQASGGWAGVYAYNTRVLVDGCSLDDSGDLGFYHYNDSARTAGRATVRATSLSGNGRFGGHLYNVNGTFTQVQALRNGKYADGSPTGRGGYGIYVYDSSGDVGQDKNVVISESQLNENATYGFYASYQNQVTLQRTSLRKNSDWAATIYYSGADIKNCVVTDNRAGLYLYDDGDRGHEVWNNTLAGHVYAGLVAQHTQVTARNNIFANGEYGVCVYDTASWNASHNLVYGTSRAPYWHSSKPGSTLRGGHDLDKGPRFVDAVAGDYRLDKGSPAINAGYAAVGIVDTDYLGNARPMFKSHEIGAFEFTDPSGSVRVMSWNEQK